MVDLLIVGARDSLVLQRLADGPSKVGQLLDVLEADSSAVSRTRKNQFPPQATSPQTLPYSRHIDRDVGGQAITRYIVDVTSHSRCRTALTVTHGSFDAMLSGLIRFM